MALRSQSEDKPQSDAGAFLLADAYGAARLSYVKDVDGVYTSDPATANKKRPELIRRIGGLSCWPAISTPFPSTRWCWSLWHTPSTKGIQVVNGLTLPNITKSLCGEHVGTIIHPS